jgi:hypothetical protein
MARPVFLSPTPGISWGGIVTVLVCLNLVAPAAAETSEQLWLDYNPSWMLSEKVSFGGDMGYRTRLDVARGFRLVLRPGVDLPYRFLTFKAGIGNFWSISDDITNRWEIRPYQGVGWVWPRTRVIFDHLARLEERFDFNTVTWNSVNSLRGRYRLRLRFPFGMKRPDRFWRAYASGEMFLKLAGEEGLQREQFRLTLGLERSFSRLLRIRAQITWQQEELFLLPSESSDDVYFRFRVYQNF